jgi:hypothetical protein
MHVEFGGNGCPTTTSEASVSARTHPSEAIFGAMPLVGKRMRGADGVCLSIVEAFCVLMMANLPVLERLHASISGVGRANRQYPIGQGSPTRARHPRDKS